MILGKNELPGAVIGERVFLLPDPPKEETEYGLHIPEVAQLRPFTGVLIDAGLKALDQLYDQGIEIGDHVWWGKFAGVIQEWDHIIEDGNKPCSEHRWARVPTTRDRTSNYTCDTCGAKRTIESLIVANVEDIQVSVELGQRRRDGRTKYRRGVTKDTEATQHVIEREGD